MADLNFPFKLSINFLNFNLVKKEQTKEADHSLMFLVG